MNEDDLDGERLLRALEALDRWESGGRACSVAELLEEHADLADLLEPMLVEPGPQRAPQDSLSERTRAHLERLPATDLGARYELGELLGRGGMGTVHRIVDRALGRELALKRSTYFLPTDSGQGAVGLKLTARFLEEAQITGQLDHPGIVPLHELALDDAGQPYFTMKMVRGQTLAEVFARLLEGDEAWPLPRVLGLLQRVCETMTFAHERGVIHRDLKPDNVMIGAHGEVYVMDWGLALALGSAVDHAVSVSTTRSRERALEEASPLKTAEGTLVGTPAYMAPEQARGELSRVDERSDVYAVGGMLFEALAGHPPFFDPGSSTGGQDCVQRLRQGWTPDVLGETEGAPPELQAVCAKAMAREATDRYATMGALRDDLRDFLEGRVVAAHRTGAWAELRTWVRRNRALAAALATAGCVLVLGILGTSRGLALERAANERQRRTSYFQAISMAQAALNRGQGALADEYLQGTPADLRGWEWRHLDASLAGARVLDQRPAMIILAEFLAEPQRVVVADVWGRVTIRDLEGEALSEFHAEPAPYNRAVLAREARRVVLAANLGPTRLVALDLDTGQLAWEREMPGKSTCLAVRPNGRELWVHSAGREDRLESLLFSIDLANGEILSETAEVPFGNDVKSLAWSSPDHLVVLTREDAIVVEASTLAVLGTLEEPGSRVGAESVAHMLDQRVWPERSVLLHPSTTGVDFYSLPGLEHEGFVSTESCSLSVIGGRDGRTLLGAQGGELRRYDVPLGIELGQSFTTAHSQKIHSLSLDGRYLLTVESSWSPRSSSQHQSRVFLWRTDGGQGLRVAGVREGHVASQTWRLIESHWSEVRITDLRDGQPLAPIATAGLSPTRDVALCDGERRLVLLYVIGSLALEVLDLEGARSIAGLTTDAVGRYSVVAGDPTGSRCVVASAAGPLELRSCDDLALLATLECPLERVTNLEFTRDGARLVATGPAGAVAVWSLEGPPQLVAHAQLDEGEFLSIALAPDGLEVALGTRDGALLLARMDDLEVIARTEPGKITSDLAWSPDGTRLACCTLGDLNVLDTQGLRLVFSLRHGSDPRNRCGWDQSGERLAMSTPDAGLIVLEASTPAPELSRRRSASRLARLAALSASGNKRRPAAALAQLRALELDEDTHARAREWLPSVGPIASRLRDRAIYLGNREGASAATLERAVELARAALELAPERPRFRETLLGLLFRLERNEELVTLTEALPEPRGTWDEDTGSLLRCQAHRAVALSALGRSEQTRAEVERLAGWRKAVPERLVEVHGALLETVEALLE